MTSGTGTRDIANYLRRVSIAWAADWMNRRRGVIALANGFVAFCLLFACMNAHGADPVHAAEDLQADLAQFVDAVVSTHPDIAHSTDMRALRSAAAGIHQRLREPMTTREAWKVMAELNPLFHDAHTGLHYPADEFESYRKGGGAVFPVPVLIDDNGILRAAEGVEPSTGIVPHEEIVSINDLASQQILDDAMPRMRGETAGLQRLVLEFNFAAYLWTLYGPATSYEVVVRDADGHRRKVSLPRDLDLVRARPSQPFRYEKLRDDVGYIEVRSFDPNLKDEFDRFLETTFASIRESGARKLIIDIRRNPGGAHELSDALIGYLTSRRVRQASSIVARILDSNRDMAPEADAGAVVTVPFDEWLTPPDRADRFTGEAYLLIGRRTYSQAIVFATMFQDFELGTVAGVATDGPADQTGQIQKMPLNHTGLLALAPLYIIRRPSGDTTTGGVRPDISIADDPYDPRSMLRALLLRLQD